MSFIFEENNYFNFEIDQFHARYFNCCFCRPSNYSRNNCFLKDATFVVRTEERFCKKKLFENTIETLY